MTKLSDQELLEGNAHISDEQVRKDIADTQVEIDRLQSKRALCLGYGDRMSMMRISAYASQIEERRAFIADLEHILELRQKAAS